MIRSTTLFFFVSAAIFALGAVYGETPAPLADVQEVLSGYQTQTAAIRQRAAEEAQALRQRTIAQLQSLQDKYCRNAQLDEALAVREQIRRLQAGQQPEAFAPPAIVETAPPSPYSMRGHVGESFVCRLTGSTGGIVWGTDIYTDDSDVATAAVHAGALRNGETGLVKVTLLGPVASYPATSRNGVSSSSWGSWGGSFRVENAAWAGSTIGIPGLQPNCPSPSSLRGRIGESYVCELTGRTGGIVWGTDVYTDDSDVATAAVHAGALRSGETGPVKVTIVPPQSSYSGSTRNGVTSSPYSSWGGSFRVEPAARWMISTTDYPAVDTSNPDTLMSLATTPGQTFVFNVTGTTDGYLWGSEIYTTDSKLSTAAVHAAILQPGQTGRIRVTILPGRASYPGVVRHGVTSHPWGSYPLSYSLRRE